MTLKELKTLLNTSGVKFKYHHWKEPPSLPYGVYLSPSTDNFKADGRVYLTHQNIIVELYTLNKDVSKEKALTDVLDSADIFYEKTSEIYLKEDCMYMVSYEFEI